MRIEELKPSKRISGRWLAMMEDGSILRVGEGEVIDFALYAGKELSDEEAELLLNRTRISGLKEKALSLLSHKPMSRREMERKLADWEAAEQETADICDRLEELGLLNDREYAGRVAAHYGAKGYGSGKIRDELYRRGVPRELWDEALAGVAQSTDAIDEFIRRKLKGERDPDRKQLQQVSGALARRGFRWDEIKEALARYGAETWEE